MLIPVLKLTADQLVSLLSHISNVFERIIYNYINEHVLFLSKIQT